MEKLTPRVYVDLRKNKGMSDEDISKLYEMTEKEIEAFIKTVPNKVEFTEWMTEEELRKKNK